MTKADRVFNTPRRTASKTKPKLNVVEDKIDYKAVLARAEHVVALLRTCHVCEGWKMDEEGAARTLKYFRARADGRRDNAEEWQATIDFVGSHGQSLDWIVAGDPGTMICWRAAKSERAASVGTSPTETGPTEHDQHLATAYRRMEDHVCDLERMGEIAERLVMEFVDDRDNGCRLELANFAAQHLADMLHQFNADYQASFSGNREEAGA